MDEVIFVCFMHHPGLLQGDTHARIARTARASERNGKKSSSGRQVVPSEGLPNSWAEPDRRAWARLGSAQARLRLKPGLVMVQTD